MNTSNDQETSVKRKRKPMKEEYRCNVLKENGDMCKMAKMKGCNTCKSHDNISPSEVVKRRKIENPHVYETDSSDTEIDEREDDVKPVPVPPPVPKKNVNTVETQTDKTVIDKEKKYDDLMFQYKLVVTELEKLQIDYTSVLKENISHNELICATKLEGAKSRAYALFYHRENELLRRQISTLIQCIKDSNKNVDVNLVVRQLNASYDFNKNLMNTKIDDGDSIEYVRKLEEKVNKLEATLKLRDSQRAPIQQRESQICAQQKRAPGSSKSAYSAKGVSAKGVTNLCSTKRAPGSAKGSCSAKDVYSSKGASNWCSAKGASNWCSAKGACSAKEIKMY